MAEQIHYGHITFARVSTDEMWLHLTDTQNHIEVLRLKMSLEDFARIITGQSDRPCTFAMRPDHLGKDVEQKHEIVPYDGSWMDSNEDKRKALAPFEVDGWQGSLSDLGNGHRRTKKGYRVSFTRYVTKD